MRFFDNAYEGTPTWDIGRPHAAVVRLVAAGQVTGSVVDVGCGTGEDALYLAGLGFAVTGVDFAGAAIERARAKALERGLPVEFLARDAFTLPDLGRQFDTALDLGLFHTLHEERREAYAACLRAIVKPGGRCLLLCWSDLNPFGRGPERISKRDIREAFADGWTVEAIDAEPLETRLEEGTVHGWLARLRCR